VPGTQDLRPCAAAPGPRWGGDMQSPPPFPPGPSLAVRRGTCATGAFFATCAVVNALGTLRGARPFLAWCRDGAWLPPYRAVLARLVPGDCPDFR